MKKGEEDSMDEEEASKPETQPPSKKRKAAEKTVVRVRIEGGFGTQKNESPPSDSWSWRKYGQKPIKGSPFPRGYYRCSTSKGCSAKKQVERCKTEDSVLVITYTSSHNHPDRRTPTAKQKLSLKEQEQEQEEQEQDCGHPYKTSPSKDEFRYLDQAIDLFSTVNHMETEAGTTISMGLAMLEEEEGVVPRPPGLPEFVKTEEMEEMENDFFDELEELFPTVSSSFKRVLFQERVPDAVSSS